MNRLYPILILLPAFSACGDKTSDTADSDTDGGGDADTDADTDGDTDTDADTVTNVQPTTDVEVYINEIVASNASGLQDEFAAFPDWVEIWNGTGAELDLSGWFLTDDDSWTDKWAFPSNTLVPANGYVVVFCDGDVLDGTMHTSFKLQADGEYLGLYSPLADGNRLADMEDYPLLAVDTAWARQPDGGAFAEDPTPTPEATNQ